MHPDPAAGDDPAAPVAESTSPAALSSPTEPRWSLWGDAEA